MGDYARRIEAAGASLQQLDAIIAELSGQPEHRLLLIKAIARRRQVAGGQSEPRDWLADLGLPPKDGRPLYLYRLSDASFHALQTELQSKRKMLADHKFGSLAGKFALWASEWFRRHYDGTQRNWSDLGEPIGLAMQQSDWRRLADDGLRYWRIPELHLNGTHHRLAAIARQGGFPVAALEGAGSGWAKAFLERVVSILLAQESPTADVADTICEDHLEMVPQTWRSKEIRVIAAELAIQIVRLRRKAEEAGVPPGSPISLWLDENIKDWRDGLPVSIDSAAGKALVDGLFLAEAAKPVVSIRAERLLQLGPDVGRRELVKLELDGKVQDQDGKSVLASLATDWNRLRLYASQEFARYVSGELAIADPDAEGRWLCRPTSNRVIYDVPAEVAISLELRGGGARVGEPFMLRGGERVGGSLRVYVAVGDNPDDTPSELKLIGTGSRGYDPDRVFVDVPDDWTCAANDLNSRCSRVQIDPNGSRTLWLVQGSAIVTTPRQDRYLVRTGQKGDMRDELILSGRSPPGCRPADASLALFLGQPTFTMKRGAREWLATQELWWRRPGSNTWRPDRERSGFGSFEFAWLDTTTRHIRDRRDAVVLPEDFRVQRRSIKGATELSIIGWEGSVRLNAGTSFGSGVWQLGTRDLARSVVCATLSSNLTETCVLEIPIPHPPWIASWTDGPLPSRQSLSHSAINRFVALAVGKSELCAVLVDRNDRVVPGVVGYWRFDQELPLSTIADDIAVLLSALGDTGAKLKLSFTHDTNDVWFVTPYECRLEQQLKRLAPDRRVQDPHARIVGRSPVKPANEVDLGPYEAKDDGTIAPVNLPPLAGDWLVYLRAGERVLSAPRVVRGELPAEGADTLLAQTMMIADRAVRIDQLGRLCDDMLSAPVVERRAFVQTLIEIATSLDGLPSSTFDVLAVLPSRPRLATQMLFQASEEQLLTLYHIDDTLPFAWEMLPAAAWRDAGQEEMEHLLQEHLLQLVPDAQAYIYPIIARRTSKIANDIPVLKAVFGLERETRGLKDLANDFITRADGRIDQDPSPFRPACAASLPSWSVADDYWRALDAPVAAAMAACERIKLSHAQIACVKSVSRKHPRWFYEGFVAAFFSHQAKGN